MPKVKSPPGTAKPYVMICVSTYLQDLEQLDAKVAELKKRGWRKMNRSMLLRLAMSKLDVSTVEVPTVQ